MRYVFVFEPVESRTHLSATASVRSGARIIGPTSGVHAAAATPVFASLSTKSTANPSDPNNSADLDTAIKLTIIPADGHGGIDATNLQRAAVRLTDLTNNKVYVSTGNASELQRVKTSGGGDVLVIQTNDPLPKNHSFRVEINGSFVTSNLKVRDVQGTAFAAFTGTFKTGEYLPPSNPAINFTQVAQGVPGNKTFLATTIGPDHRLYASTTDGYVYRYDIADNGNLSNEFQIATVRANNGGAARIITGITFDPQSTAGNLALWVSHNQYRFGNAPDGSKGDVERYADNFTGKISVISGTNLANYQDKIVGIPRSAKDHMNNQLVFDPKGKNIYFGVAGLNAMGAPDPTWANRVENIYSASIIRAVVGGEGGLNRYVSERGPVNLSIDGNPNTADGLTPGTLHYNIFKGSNPVRLFATGIRNAFDLTFASNGRLYANINGSSAGGNVPATPAFGNVPIQNRIDKDKYRDKNGNYLPYTGPSSPSLTRVGQVEQDFLLEVQEGKYYGHPNPSRGEYIFDGADPTPGSDNDPFEISSYPDGQQVDRNYQYPVYDYGTNFSPDGILQYKSVGGRNKALDGFLLSTRYSGGSDILALQPDAKTGKITKVEQRINGFTKLGSPLDIVEDMTNGNIYVTSLEIDNTGGSIMLLRPGAASSFAPAASRSASKLGFYVTPGGDAVARSVTIENTGNADLVFDPATSRISGSGRKNFLFKKFPTSAFTIVPGATLTLTITGQLLKNQTSTVGATLLLKTNDPSLPDGFVQVALRAFNANA